MPTEELLVAVYRFYSNYIVINGMEIHVHTGPRARDVTILSPKDWHLKFPVKSF